MCVFSEPIQILKGQVNLVSTFSQPVFEMEKLLHLCRAPGFLLGLRTH